MRHFNGNRCLLCHWFLSVASSFSSFYFFPFVGVRQHSKFFATRYSLILCSVIFFLWRTEEYPIIWTKINFRWRRTSVKWKKILSYVYSLGDRILIKNNVNLNCFFRLFFNSIWFLFWSFYFSFFLALFLSLSFEGGRGGVGREWNECVPRQFHFLYTFRQCLNL